MRIEISYLQFFFLHPQEIESPEFKLSPSLAETMKRELPDTEDPFDPTNILANTSSLDDQDSLTNALMLAQHDLGSKLTLDQQNQGKSYLLYLRKRNEATYPNE